MGRCSVARVCIAAVGVALLLSGCLIAQGPLPLSYDVSGRVTQSECSLGLACVTLYFGCGFGTAMTRTNGFWRKTGLMGTVTVTPVKCGWEFDPPSRTVSGPTEDVDFVAQAVPCEAEPCD